MSNTNITLFNFAANTFFMKLLRTNTDIVKYCQDKFGFKLQLN